MATFVKLNKFPLNLAQKVFNLGSDTLKVALTDTVPTVTFNQLSEITEISYANLSARSVTITSSTQTSGTYKLVLADLVLTASGTVPQFRYIVLYDDTATNDELIGYWDRGSEVNLLNTDTFTLDFDASTGALTIA